MAQKIQTYTTKRSFETYSIGRFVFFKNYLIYSKVSLMERASRTLSSGSSKPFGIMYKIFWLISIIFLTGILSCGEPEIKLNRADRRSIDTLVNNQLDSISPILDSLCFEETDVIVERAVDSIVKERQKQEERLRLNVEGN